VVLQILKVHLERRGLPLADDVSVAEIAGMTMGFTGADLANLVNEVTGSMLTRHVLFTSAARAGMQDSKLNGLTDGVMR